MQRTIPWSIGAAVLALAVGRTPAQVIQANGQPASSTAAASPANPPDAPGEGDPAAGDADDEARDETPFRTFAKKKMVHRVKLTDGSIFVGKLAAGDLVIETSYGELRVPADQVLGLQPGLDHRPEQRKHIARLIRDLGAAEYKVRQDSVDELIRIGPAVRPFVEEFRDDPDAERKQLVEQILSQFDRIDSDRDSDHQTLIAEDRIETKAFTIVGRVSAEQVTVETSYATLTLPMAKVASVELFDPSRPKVLVKKLDVSGEYKANVKHYDTGVRLRRGDRVFIKADGKITMSPWGSNAFSVPDGMPNYGTYMNNIHQGALVARVGDSGQVFKVGAEHSFTAEKSGVLQLAVAINHSYINHNFPGEYEVNIRVDRAKD